MICRFGAASCRLSETDTSLLHKLEQDAHVVLCRATDPEYAPKSLVAVLAYIVQSGIECELSRHIQERIDEVWDIYVVMGQVRPLL